MLWYSCQPCEAQPDVAVPGMGQSVTRRDRSRTHQSNRCPHVTGLGSDPSLGLSWAGGVAAGLKPPQNQPSSGVKDTFFKTKQFSFHKKGLESCVTKIRLIRLSCRTPTYPWLLNVSTNAVTPILSNTVLLVCQPVTHPREQAVPKGRWQVAWLCRCDGRDGPGCGQRRNRPCSVLGSRAWIPCSEGTGCPAVRTLKPPHREAGVATARCRRDLIVSYLEGA